MSLMVSFLYSLSLSGRLWVGLTLAFSDLLLFSSLADFFPGYAQTAVQAIEADREARRAAGEEVVVNAPRTLDEQLLSIEARLRPAHRMLRRLQRVGAQAIAALWPKLP